MVSSGGLINISDLDYDVFREQKIGLCCQSN
jgi:hypothetical protein